MATKITTRVLADNAVTDAKIADVTLTTATQSASDNTTKIATTAYVTTAIANLADSAPSTLNTLNELAAALGDDANFSTTVTNSIAAKLPLAGGTLTGDVQAPGVYIGSTNTSFDLYNNGTSYLNGSVVIDDSLQVTGGFNMSSGTLEFADGNASFDSSNSSGYPVFSHTNGSAQIGFARTGGSTGIGYIGADSTNVFAVWDSAFNRKMVISQAGNVGIGTDTPDCDLHINGANNSEQVIITGGGTASRGLSISTVANNGQNNAGVIFNAQDTENAAYPVLIYQTGGTERMRIDGSGNVGIGTNSPASLLHLDEGSADDCRIIAETHAGGDSMILFSQGASGSGTPTWGVGLDSGSGTSDGFSIGYEDTGYNDFSLTGDTKLVITTAGNVGIGTTTPSDKLEVSGTGGTRLKVTNTNTNWAALDLQAGGNQANYIFFRDDSAERARMTVYDGNDIAFSTGNSPSEKMRIDSTGRVGINRTPSKSNSKLEVGGADNVGLIHVEASGNFASWGIGSNQSKFYYNDTQMMGLTNIGELKLMGGSTTGRQDIVFNNGNMSLADNAAYTLSGIANTGCLIAIGQQRSNVGVTYDHCLIFVETGTAATVVANPSGRFSINTSGTDSVTNVYVSGGNVVLENKVGTTNSYTFSCFVFQGN